MDKTPTAVSVTAPVDGGVLSAPFNIPATATFKPTLSGTKGTIALYVDGGDYANKTCTDNDGKTKTWTYAYDYENRLVKAVKQESDETVTFKYDPFGGRVEKRVEEIEGGTTETKAYAYVYDNEDVVLEYQTMTEDGSTKTEVIGYVHGPGIDEPLAIERKGDVYYYHADGLGGITALTDDQGKTVERYTYSAFGDLKRKGDKVKSI